MADIQARHKRKRAADRDEKKSMGLSGWMKGCSLWPSDPFSLGTFCHRMSNCSIDFSITISPDLVLHTKPVAIQ